MHRRDNFQVNFLYGALLLFFFLPRALVFISNIPVRYIVWNQAFYWKQKKPIECAYIYIYIMTWILPQILSLLRQIILCIVYFISTRLLQLLLVFLLQSKDIKMRVLLIIYDKYGFCQKWRVVKNRKTSTYVCM